MIPSEVIHKQNGVIHSKFKVIPQCCPLPRLPCSREDLVRDSRSPLVLLERCLMGAKNVAAVYQRYAGRIPGSSIAVLIYMALVSKDRDPWPWFALGHHALAEHALGRSNPGDADLRAVARAMGPLLDCEAVTVDRGGASRAGGNTTARYRLNIHAESDEERRLWLNTPDGKRRASNPHRKPRDPTVCDGDTRRKVARDPTVSGERPDGNRRTKETRGDKRSEKTKEEGRSSTASHPSRAREPDGTVIEFPPRRRYGSAADTIAEASASRRRAEASYRAEQETS